MEITSKRISEITLFILFLFCIINCDTQNHQEKRISIGKIKIDSTKNNPHASIQTSVYKDMLSKVKSSEHYITVQEAKKKWGNQKFNANDYIKGDEKTRASMVGNLIESKVLIGKSTSELTNLLGRQSGYYFDDSYPAFIFITGAPPKKTQKNSFNEFTWQIVCLPGKNHKIEEVFIHRQ